ncbi:hypothetical protein B0H14DRAFT_3895000 [Mycena olivaceomarginata]|nr:hypothetical protein B0H14DRAFT_3895000 [Mycena olivaceomarginata]
MCPLVLISYVAPLSAFASPQIPHPGELLLGPSALKAHSREGTPDPVVQCSLYHHQPTLRSATPWLTAAEAAGSGPGYRRYRECLLTPASSSPADRCRCRFLHPRFESVAAASSTPPPNFCRDALGRLRMMWKTGCRNARAAEQDDGATLAGYDTSLCQAQGCGRTRCIEPRRGLAAGRVLTLRTAVRSASVLVIREPGPHFRSLRSAWTPPRLSRRQTFTQRGTRKVAPVLPSVTPLPPPRDQYWAHSCARVHQIHCRPISDKVKEGAPH